SASPRARGARRNTRHAGSAQVVPPDAPDASTGGRHHAQAAGDGATVKADGGSRGRDDLVAGEGANPAAAHRTIEALHGVDGTPGARAGRVGAQFGHSVEACGGAGRKTYHRATGRTDADPRYSGDRSCRPAATAECQATLEVVAARRAGWPRSWHRRGTAP